MGKRKSSIADWDQNEKSNTRGDGESDGTKLGRTLQNSNTHLMTSRSDKGDQDPYSIRGNNNSKLGNT